jgi:hypothetical protein
VRVREKERDETREEACGRLLGCRLPEDALVGGTCCILQQLLQLLLECPSVLQNEDADRAAAIARDSLTPLSNSIH